MHVRTSRAAAKAAFWLCIAIVALPFGAFAVDSGPDGMLKVPAPDVVPWFVARRVELAAVALLASATLAVDLAKHGLASSLRQQLARVRLSALIALFGVVALWGAEMQRRRTDRREWQRSLHVAVTLISTAPLDPDAVTAFERATARATRFMLTERRRYAASASPPCWLHTFGPARVDHEPPRAANLTSIADRARYRWSLGGYFADVDRRTHLTANRFDVRIYVRGSPPAAAQSPRVVEGIGEAEGELGLVEVDLDESTVELAWSAVLHELLHTVGATDKYDERGHALLPVGLAEPARVPVFPQRYAEIMAAELPLGPDRGRVINSLDELRVGAVTAREIGWR